MISVSRAGTGKFRSAKQMWEAWEQYKRECDNKTVSVTEFSAKNSEFVTADIKRPVSCTITGFADFCDMTRQNFYATYAHNPKFDTVIARIAEKCETDAREKFEQGSLDPRLAALWMSNYGYSTKPPESEEALTEAKKILEGIASAF